MRGHIRSRGQDGRSWSIIIDLGKDAEGKRKQKWHTFHGTKREAERERTRLLNELNTGTYVEPTKLTVRQYLDRWLKEYAKSNVSAKTYQTYAEFVRLHLAPALGHHQLAKLAPLHIQEYYTRALESGRKDGKGGLSAQSVLHHHRVLHEALHQAVKWQLLARNPADAVEPPRPASTEMAALDVSETARLLEAAAGTWLHLPILLAVTTGMRRGELLGLRWQDVDLKAGKLTVQQAVEETRAGVTFKQPKTQRSRRPIDLPPLLVEALIRHKGEQAQERLLMGAAYQDQGLVIAQPDGQVRRPDNLSHAFLKLTRAHGIKLRFHDLRHSHASHLLAAGVHLKVVSERLGHSSTRLTLDTYSHLLPGMGEDAALKVDVALRFAIDQREGKTKRIAEQA